MPELGKYAKVPRPESVALLLKYLMSNKTIADIEHPEEQIFIIHRNGKSDLKTFLTNIYIVSLADVCEIMALVPDLQVIITLSAWNSYTNDAKEYCKKQQIGLFKFKEFLGAVYYDGKNFLDYISPEDRKPHLS